MAVRGRAGPVDPVVRARAATRWHLTGGASPKRPRDIIKRTPGGHRQAEVLGILNRNIIVISLEAADISDHGSSRLRRKEMYEFPDRHRP